MRRPVRRSLGIRYGLLAVAISAGAPLAGYSQSPAQSGPEPAQSGPEPAQSGPEPGPGPSVQSSEPDADGDVPHLILKLEGQIAGGRLNAPSGNNAGETFARILALALSASPSDQDAIDRLPARLSEDALEAKAIGDQEVAQRFLAFRDTVVFGRGDAVAAEQATPPLALPAANPPPPSDAPDLAQEDHAKAEGQPGASAAPSADANAGASAAGQTLAVLPAPPPETQAPSSPNAAEPRAENRAEADGRAKPPDTPAVLPRSAATIAALIRRGEQKVAENDIAAARLLFGRAADASSAAGAARLAQTYDPAYLAGIGATHVAADAGRATELYRVAITLGDQDAAAALSRLERWKARNANAPAARATSGP